jgi:hypothetical protein
MEQIKRELRKRSDFSERKFEWRSYPDCLKYGPVAVTFTNRRGYEALIFSRITAFGAYDPDFEVTEQEEWILIPDESGVFWAIKRNGLTRGRYAAKELAFEIFEKLVSYHDAYHARFAAV